MQMRRGGRHGDNKQKWVLPHEQLIGAHKNERKQHGEIDEIRVTQNTPEQHIPAEHIAERTHERRPFASAAAKTIEREREGR